MSAEIIAQNFHVLMGTEGATFCYVQLIPDNELGEERIRKIASSESFREAISMANVTMSFPGENKPRKGNEIGFLMEVKKPRIRKKILKKVQHSVKTFINTWGEQVAA